MESAVAEGMASQLQDLLGQRSVDTPYHVEVGTNTIGLCIRFYARGYVALHLHYGLGFDNAPSINGWREDTDAFTAIDDVEEPLQTALRECLHQVQFCLRLEGVL